MYLKERNNNKKGIHITLRSANTCPCLISAWETSRAALSQNALCETEGERHRNLPGCVVTSSFLLSLTLWRGTGEKEVWKGRS